MEGGLYQSQNKVIVVPIVVGLTGALGDAFLLSEHRIRIKFRKNDFLRSYL